MIKKITVVVFLFLLLPACSSIKVGPPLEEIYGRSAKYHGIERNPVIVIPGIMGSKLKDQESQKMVWGGFGKGYLNPNDPTDIRLISLPINDGSEVYELEDTIVPDGVLETLNVNLYGLPLGMKAYYSIVRALGAGGYVDEDIHDFNTIDYGKDHFTCFQFSYDWRKDIAYNAKMLSEFIKEKKELVQKQYKERFNADDVEVKFDIVAHSMGGLITRYFLMFGEADLTEDMEVTWEGTKHVSSAALVGTPNAGSLDAFDNLVNGLNFSILLPTFSPAIVGTIPAVYQLLPRNRHLTLFGLDDNLPYDPLDFKTWEKFNWGLLNSKEEKKLEYLLPQVSNKEERLGIAKDFIKKVLDRTKMLHDAIDKPAGLPQNFELKLFAGDAVPTPSKMTVDSEGKIRVLEKKPGDGIVLRSSALMDERIGSEWSPVLKTPIDWSNVTFIFEDHLGLVRSPVFVDNILYFLLEKPIRRQNDLDG
jgi:lecithin:cholesterol acyltransferase